MRHVLIYTDENGEWCASVPSLPGCYSQGETVEETLANIKEAIELHIESMIAHGEDVPDEPEQMELILLRLMLIGGQG